MSEAIRDMVAFLIQAPGWKPESLPGPAKRVIVSQPARPVRTQPAAIKGKILAALKRGPATGEEIAAITRCNIHSVHAKLSQMHQYGLVARTKSAISPQTGRAVQVYELK